MHMRGRGICKQLSSAASGRFPEALFSAFSGKSGNLRLTFKPEHDTFYDNFSKNTAEAHSAQNAARADVFQSTGAPDEGQGLIRFYRV